MASCPVEADGTGFARPCDGVRWDAEGDPPGEGAPLRRVPAQLHDGSVWIDPS